MHPSSADPLVSVVVTSYDYATVLPRALDSVLVQTQGDWELIVVDDGSTDSSRQVAQTFADAHPDRRVTLLFARNGGLGRARNLGISVARGKYITCLDADDHFAPTALEKLSAALESDPSADVARPFLQSFGVEQRIWEYPAYDFDASTSVNQAPYCALFRRTAWQRAGGYDEGMPAYEDWNFWIALGKHGCHMTRVAEPLLHYRTSTDGMFARHRGHDLVLRATLVAHHPEVYDAASQKLAERILAGEDVDAELATGTPHAIFDLSYRARTLRGEDISTDFGAVS
ncbi:glycosyltransferase family 2 protein [Streptomyces sp. NPDC058534]|uniref:glycosyltransferase family 2 protein n=1 Tax=Streptomyces sp. NPDC058534 TaxID=3346541 RepID=UPI00364C4E96